MSLDPILNAPALIQFHAAAAMLALVLGPVAIHRQRRDRLHKVVGYIWVSTMLGVAISALFIPSFGLAFVGHFGPIHLLAFLALWSLWQGMRAIYRRDIKAHKNALSGLYWQGLTIAGLVNFLPGRMISRALFPDMPGVGIAVLIVGGLGLVWFNWVRHWVQKGAAA